MAKDSKETPSALVLQSADPKRQAFTAAADAIGALEKRPDQMDVLRAVAAFFGFTVQIANGEQR